MSIYIYIYLYICIFTWESACEVMDSIIGNGHGDQSSNSGWTCLHFI